MKKITNYDDLTKTEQDIMKFLLDEHRSLEEEIEVKGHDEFIDHYRDQTGYIMHNVESILKRKDSTRESIVTPKQMEELIGFLAKEYSHAADTIDPRATEDATYIEGIVNEAKFFTSRICCILGLDADILKEKQN